MMSSPQSIALPAAMETCLRQIRRRQWLFALLQTTAVTASTFVVALLFALVIDWVWTLRDHGIRIVLTGGTLILPSVVALVTLWWRLPPLLTTTFAANRADAAIPQLEERWTTVVTLRSARTLPTTGTAQAMMQQVVHEAAAMGRLVQPQAVARPESSFRAVAAAGICLVLLLGFLSVDWPQTSVLLQRFWHPTAEITATQLVSATGDVVVPRGEFLDLDTHLQGVPRSQALLLIARDNVPLETVPLSYDSAQPAQFTHRLRVDDNFRYQVQAGDGRTEWHSVVAVDPPALAEVEFTVDAPKYVTRPRLEKTHIPSRIKVLQGCRLSLRMRPTAALTRCELALTTETENAATRVVPLKADNNGWYRFVANLDTDLTLVPHLWNEQGLTNDDAPVCRIQVLPDQAPVARILGSNAEAAVADDDVLKIEFEAHDDQGIASAQLVVYDESGVENGEPPRILHLQDIPLGNQELQKHVLASLELDLQKLDLAPGSQISYAIRVMDNRMLQLDPQRSGAPRVADRDDEPGAETSGHNSTSPPPGGKKSAPSPGNRSDDIMREMVARDDATPRSNDTQSTMTGDPATAATQNDQPGSNDTSQANTTSSQGNDHADGRGDAIPSDVNAAAVSALFPDNVPLSIASRENHRQRSPDADGAPSRSRPEKKHDGTSESATSPLMVRADPTKSDGTPAMATDSSKEPVRPDAPNIASANKTGNGSPSESLTKTPSSRNQTSGNGDRAESPVNVVTTDATTDDAKHGGTSSTTSPKSDGAQPVSKRDKPTFQMTLLDGQQDAETTRRRLRITERLAAVSAASERKAETLNVRQQVVEIDRRLGAIETGLTHIVDRQIPDADRPQHLEQLDQRLGDVEKQIGQLRSETRDGQFAFIGLQMVDIGRTHITPARERIFIAQREADVGTDRNSTLALQSVLRARELLAALLSRYDRAAQDRKLADGLEEAAKMYELYIEKAQMMMREARQTRNPLERKMEIVELEQDYLDRLAEVATLRREMLAEFARVLGDDPRLLSRYLQLSKNRRASLRDQLSQLVNRQTEIADEIRGWRNVQDAQRDELFNILVETRLQLATPLAKDAAELAEHIEKQLPLILEPIQATSSRLVKAAQELTATGRDIALDVRRQLRDPDADIPWQSRSRQFSQLCRQLEIELDQLNFENEQQTEVVEYVTTRLLETRVVADHAARWEWLMAALAQRRFASMAELDQQQLGLMTELLRVDMLGIEAGLETEFEQLGGTIPADILSLVGQLHALMEAITFNQSSATFLFSQTRIDDAGAQQTKAVERLEQAEKLFDDIRRKVVTALDELPPPPPNIADLRDPTLDEFLAGLEREPNIEAQLGLPNRRRNLRVIADEMEWQENGAGMMGQAADEANQRALETERQSEKPFSQPQTADRELTDEERQERAHAEQNQQELAKALAEMKRRAEDPTTSQEERERLERLMQGLQPFTDDSRSSQGSPHLWNQIAQSDQAKAALAAIAAGKAIPDQQWNKLLSSLDDGLLQVGGRTLPAEYRRAIEQYQNRLRRMLDGTRTTDE